MNFDAHLKQDARLVILKELAKQGDYRLNETILVEVLDAFGYRKSRDWLRAQLRALQESGAVTLIEAGTILVATITQAGLDHVERRRQIDGVARPSPEE